MSKPYRPTMVHSRKVGRAVNALHSVTLDCSVDTATTIQSLRMLHEQAGRALADLRIGRTKPETATALKARTAKPRKGAPTRG